MTIESDPHNRLGEAVTLDPPVTVGGTAYGLALRWTRQGHQSVSICSARIYRVDDLGSGRKRVVFERGAQVSSITVVEGPGVSYELQQTHYCGGNVCPRPEPFAIWSYSNELAMCGGQEGDRAQPCDCLEVTQGGVTRRWLIEEVEAYADEPSSVDYSSPDALPTNTVVRNEHCYEYPALAGDEELVQDSAAGAAFADAGFGWWDGSTEGSKTFLQRVEFTPAGSRVVSPYTGSDADWYPADASFSTSAGQYWYDPVARRCIIGSYVAGLSPAAWWVVWYVRTDELRAVSYLDGSTVLRAALQGMGAGLDLGGSSDQVALAVEPQADRALDYVIQVYGASGSAAGDCGVLVAAADLSAWIAVDYNGSGWQVQYRDGSVSAGSTLAPGAAFEVRFLRSDDAGNTWDVQWRLVGGGSWTGLLVGLSLDLGDSVLTGSYAASGAWIWTAPAVASGRGEWTHQQVGTTGTSYLSIRHTESNTAAADFGPLTYTLPAAEAIEEVVDLTTYPDETTMAQSATPARNHYGFSGGQVTVYPESAMDRVRVTQEAPATPASGPGPYPPVLSNAQLNMSTDGGTVGQNRLNWRDSMIVVDVRAEVATGIEGAVGNITRNAGGDPRNPAAVLASPSAQTAWTVVDPGSVYWFAEENLALVAQAWLDANLDRARKYHYARSGVGFQANGGIDATMHNQVARCFDAIDTGWVRGAQPGTTGYAYFVQGAMEICYPALQASGGQVVPSEVSMGLHLSTILGFDPRLLGTGAPACGPLDLSGALYGWSFARYPVQTGGFSSWQGCTNAAESNGTVDLGGGVTYCDHNTRGIEGALWWEASDDIALGGTAVAISSSYGASKSDTAFSVAAAGIALDIAGFWAHVPDGATVVRAWAEFALPAGSAVYTTAEYLARQPISGGGTPFEQLEWYGTRETINGTVAREERWEWDSGSGTWVKTVDTTNTPPATAGSSFGLAWGLYGRRRHTRRLRVPEGPATATGNAWADDLGSDEVVSLGVSAEVTVEADGKHHQVDLTSVVASLVADRGSLLKDYFLFPTVNGGAAVEDFDGEGFVSLVRAGLPSSTVELITGDPGEWGLEYEHTGCRTIALQYAPEIEGAVLVQFRLPSGAITDPVAVGLKYPRTSV